MSNDEVRAKLQSMKSDMLIAGYLIYRARKKQLTADFKKADAALEVAMETIANEMHSRLLDSGQQSAATKMGTAYFQKQTFAKSIDRAAIIAHVQKTGDFDIFNNAVSKDYCVAYRVAHKLPPPGVEMRDEVAVLFRKPGDDT